MTLAVTSRFADIHARLNRSPVYKLVIDGISTTYSSAKLGTSKVLMSLPTGTESVVTLEEGKSTASNISAVFADVDEEITRLVAEGIFGRIGTWYCGYKGITDEADFAIIHRGPINVCYMTDDNLSYVIGCISLDSLANIKVFQTSSGELTATMGAHPTVDTIAFTYTLTTIGLTVEVESTATEAEWTAYLDATYGSGNWTYDTPITTLYNTTIYIGDTSGFLSSGMVLVDQEYISYSGKTSTTLTGLVRALNGSIAKRHDIGTKVQEVIVKGPGHPIDEMLSALTNTNKTGGGVPLSAINVTQLEALRATIGADLLMSWYITKEENLKDWIEKEIFKPLAGYLILTDGGKISGTQYARPVTAVQSISHDSIKQTGDALRITYDCNYTSVYNSVQFKLDYNPASLREDKYLTTTQEYVNQASIDRYGKKPLVIASKGFRLAHAGTAAYLAGIAQLILDRCADGGAPLVKATVLLQKMLIEAGDIISVTTDILPNRATGRRGITNSLFEVLGRANIYDKGDVELRLLWTGWNL